MSETNEHAFLGEEFLTWIWYRTETKKAVFPMEDGAQVGIALDDLLVFGGADENEMQQTLRRGMPTRAMEAAAALKAGKRLSKAKMILAEGNDQWSFTLDGATLSFSSVRCPEPDADEDTSSEGAPTPQDIDSERMDAFARLSQHFDGVYRIFLRDRLREDWERSTLQEIRHWIDHKEGERV
jgi:recombination associated protein RdgC